MTIDQLTERLMLGLSETLRNMRDFSEDLIVSVRPEYLKTTAIARTLKDSVGSSAMIGLEQDTKRVLGSSVPVGFRGGGFSNRISRAGEVDIVLSVEEGGWKYPVILIENKLYAAGYSTIEDDAVRCAEFIAAQGSEGSIEVAAVTYLRQEVQGVIVAHQDKVGNRALNRISDAAAMLASQMSVQHCHKRIKLTSTACTSRDEALLEDDNGMPAYLAQPTYTIWGAVELFWQTRTRSLLSKLP